MEDEERKRPAWVWVVAVYIFGSTLLALLGFYVVLGSHLPVPPASRAVIDNMTSLDWGVVAVSMTCNVAGAILLVMLRRPAPYLFAATFAISLLHTAWQLATGSPGVPSAWAMAVGFGIAMAIVAYAFHLRDRGMLV